MWYGAQLLLNFLWTPLFFKAHSPTLALVDITGELPFNANYRCLTYFCEALDVTLAVTTALFFKQSKVAGGLLVPYLGWSLFATALTADIVCNNRQVTLSNIHSNYSPLPLPSYLSGSSRQRAGSDFVSSTSHTVTPRTVIRCNKEETLVCT